MNRALYIAKMIDGFPETIITLFAAVLLDTGADILTIGVMVLAGFFWLLRIKREIQRNFHNKPWEAFKSLFRKRNKYGE